jgi:hypothetical protein
MLAETSHLRRRRSGAPAPLGRAAGSAVAAPHL